jgi:hypothetical protein
MSLAAACLGSESPAARMRCHGAVAAFAGVRSASVTVMSIHRSVATMVYDSGDTAKGEVYRCNSTNFTS